MASAPPDRSLVASPAVFLDRDGVLNRSLFRDGSPAAPRTVADFELLADAPEACRRLSAAGFTLVVATNQPDIGRGIVPRAVIEEMHRILRTAIPQIARIEICEAPGGGQASPQDYRRKPAAGMLLDAARALNLDLARSWLVGDRWRDIDCGKNAGVKTVFIDYGYNESLRATPDFTVQSLGDAARIILAHPGGQNLNPS